MASFPLKEIVKGVLDKEMPKIKKIKSSESCLYLIRHGKTSFNEESNERLRGWLDVPLNKDGVDEAIQDGQKLRKSGIDFIVCSDFQRSRVTADIIGKIIGAKVQSDPTLRPWNLGNYHGKLLTKEVIDEINSFILEPDKIVSNGESFNSFIFRYLMKLQRLMLYVEKYGKSMAVVTHFRNCLVTKAWHECKMHGFSINTDTMVNKAILPPGGIFRLIYKDRNWDWEWKQK